MINLLVSQSKWEDAKWLFKSSLMCSMKILGQNHVQTAQVYMDRGHFYLKWNKRNDALSQFENAYQLYEQYLSQRGMQQTSI